MFIYIVTLLQMISHASNMYDLCLQATIYNRKWNFFPLLPTRHHQTSTVDTCLQWDNYSPSPQASLCSKHFKPECFQTGGKKKVLKRSAVPSLFDFPQHLQLKNRAEATTPHDVAEVNNVQSQQITSAVLSDHGCYPLPCDLSDMKQWGSRWNSCCHIAMVYCFICLWSSSSQSRNPQRASEECCNATLWMLCQGL